MKRTGVLILGYDPNEINWENVVWGTPPDKPGRLPKGIAIALENHAELIIIAMGVKRQSDGRPGAELMKELLLQKYQELSAFRIIREAAPKELLAILEKKVQAVVTGIGTAENIKGVAEVFQAAGIEVVNIVSSPDHVSRVHKEALIHWANYPILRDSFSVSASATLYCEEDGKTPLERASLNNLVIIEPRSPLSPIAQRLLSSRAT